MRRVILIVLGLLLAATSVRAQTHTPLTNDQDFTVSNGRSLTGTYQCSRGGQFVDCLSTVTLPSRVYVGAAGCNNATALAAWDLPTSNAPTPTCLTGSNTQQGTLNFDDAETAQFEIPLPTDWTGAIDGRLVFSDASTSGTVIFNVATVCTATGGTVADDSAFNTASTFATITLGSPADALWATTVTGITATGCSAGNFLHVKTTRATDTAVSAAAVRGLELTIRRAVVPGS